MLTQNSRTELLLGPKAVTKLASSTVAVFGVGGVGSFAAEALARAGVGHIVLFDHDTVSLTNINRQLIATTKTIGKYKVDVMRDRILEINPNAIVECHPTFYTEENFMDYPLSKYSYVIDAIDTVAGKLKLAAEATKAGTPIISSMGAGNKLDPTKFEVTDIYKTSVCPLAKVMRRELKRRGVKKLKVVYSTEEALTPFDFYEPEEMIPEGSSRRSLPGSISFVPSVAGLIIAGEVIKDLTKNEREEAMRLQAEKNAASKINM